MRTINTHFISNILGFMLIVESFLMLTSAIVGEYFRESVTVSIYISVAITFAAGVFLRFLCFGKKGKEISFTSCHGIDLNKSSENFFTGKVIEPLSPKTNSKRFTDVTEIEKWMKRNFNDVYNREGTALEKGDVTTYIINK